MPPELIVPAFVLVLAANAILIALAIRSFMAERRGEVPDVRPAPAVEPETVAPPTEDVPAPKARSARGRSAANRGTPRKTPTPRPADAADGRRQRFALPPLEEDHERFNRSIATFLSGGKSDRE